MFSIFSSFPIPVKSITDWNQVPGSNTYFRTSDVAPFVNRDGELVIYNAKASAAAGASPRWAAVSPNSPVISSR